jgi:hypothetical protein
MSKNIAATYSLVSATSIGSEREKLTIDTAKDPKRDFDLFDLLVLCRTGALGANS